MRAQRRQEASAACNQRFACEKKAEPIVGTTG